MAGILSPHRRSRDAGARPAAAFLVTVFVTAFLLISLLLLVPRASGESWTESSQHDFLNGSLVNVVATPDGTLQLAPNGTLFARAGVVVPNGPPGSADSVYARMPFVLREADGTYKMWYSGLDGYRNRMLYATSPDGINWTKYGVIMDVLAPPYYWDSVGGQCVLKFGSTYHMWFSAGYWSGGPFTFWAQIYHATSTDGVHWNVTGIALPPNQNWDVGMTNSPWVVQDRSGLFWLFFSGWDGSNTRVGVATSTNGTYFVPYARNPIVDLGPSGAWDSVDTNTPAVIPGPTWDLYFAGTNRVTESIGIATSADGFNWTKSTANPVYLPDPAPAFDSTALFGPMPFNDPSGLRFYYSGGDGSTIRIGVIMNMTAYASEGTYVSRVFDSGSRLTTWHSIHETTAVPSTTSLAPALRSGDTLTPDSSWSPWTAVDSSGIPASVLRGRYVQYRLILSSPSRARTPTVDDVTVTFSLDQAPTATSLRPAGPDWIGVATLRWIPSDPEGDPQMAFEVQLSRDSTFATVALTSGPTNSSQAQWDPTGLSDGAWYWRVRLSDGVAWGPWSNSSFRLDTTPPGLSVLEPFPGSVIGSHAIPVAWTASDPYSGLDHVELRLDGGTAIPLNASVVAYVFSPVVDGPHIVQVAAFDRLLHIATVTVSVTIDTAKPKLSITSPEPGTTLSSSRITIRWEANGTGSGIALYRVRLDGGEAIDVGPDQVSYLLVGVSDGDHVFEVTAVDQAGNTATATVLFHVDTNVFSFSGPYGPWPDGVILISGIGVVGILLLRRIRRIRNRSNPPSGGS